MCSALQFFFEYGRKFRMSRNSGSFVIIDCCNTISSMLSYNIESIWGQPTYSFQSVFEAKQFIFQNYVKCVILNMDLEGALELLELIDKEFLHIVCIVYGGDEENLRKTAEKHNRIIVICNSSNAISLLDSILNKMKIMEKTA